MEPLLYSTLDVDALERRMEQRWLAVAHANLTTHSAVQIERLYDAYLDALEAYIVVRQCQMRKQVISAQPSTQDAKSQPLR